MQRKVVFHVISRFDLGGAERIALNIAHSRCQDTQFHLIEVVRGKGDFSDRFVEEMNKAGIIYHRGMDVSNKLGILFFPFRFERLVSKYTPHIIHSHTELPDLSVYLWYKLMGFRHKKSFFVRTIHNTKLWGKWKRIGKLVEMFFQNHGANIAIGQNVADCYEKIYGERALIIYNGVQEQEQKEFEGLMPGKKNIIFAGRMEPQKGIDTMITVIKELENRSDLFFHVVGKGSLADKVNEALKQFPNVKIYDCIYGLSGRLASFDYVFFPSVFEGLVLFSIESSLAKVPVIANKCPGLDETLPDNWPLVVYDNNVEDFCYIFKNLDKLNRKELGESAYNYVSQKFSIQKMQSEYEQLYERLCNDEKK